MLSSHLDSWRLQYQMFLLCKRDQILSNQLDSWRLQYQMFLLCKRDQILSNQDFSHVFHC
jgi:hypothetical protein